MQRDSPGEAPSFTLRQAMAAQARLRERLGLGEERFPLAALIGMVSDEIERCRQAGLSDEDVAGMIADATGVAVAAADVGRFYAAPEQRRPHDR